MAIVDLRTGDWHNNDGMMVWFGTGRATPSRGGEYSVLANGIHVISGMLDLATLPTAASGDEQIIWENVWLPDNVFILKVRVTVIEEPTTSGSPNLDFGLVAKDRSTEVDFNGLLAAADAFEAGTDLGVIVEYDTATTEAGVLIGTQFTSGPAYFTASPDTADWTDGTLKLDVEFYVPLTADL
jgi:hypothetical protein